LSYLLRPVMRGLDPRIQAFPIMTKPECLDGRVKPGHDDREICA
jgi:hypothetical protein